MLSATQNDSVTALILTTKDSRAYPYFQKLIDYSGESKFKNHSAGEIKFPSMISNVTQDGDVTSVFLATEDSAVLPFFLPIVGQSGESDFTYDPSSSARKPASGNSPEPHPAKAMEPKPKSR